MVKTEEKYYIVDFVASRKYFHQYPLILGLVRFLSRDNQRPIVLLPSVADREDFELTSEEVNFVLDSGYSSRNYKPLRHLAHKLLSIASPAQYSHAYIKSFLRKRYIKSGLKYLQQSNKEIDVHIIFPTLDPLSLELAQILSRISKMQKYFFYFRIVGAESRGILSSNSELDTLLSLVKQYPKKIKIGVETTGYKLYLENLGFDSSCIFWSPWPYLDDFDKQKYKNKQFKIGFLGCAKQRKGFDNIPRILNDLKVNGINFDTYIQEANFPWAEYENTKKEIHSLMGNKFQFLSSNLDLIDLQRYIGECDILILPYDNDSYSINASGILYHASDSSVPVITANGVGFADEIVKFNLGLTYTNLREISELIKRIKPMKFDFVSYNIQRNLANRVFYFN